MLNLSQTDDPLLQCDIMAQLIFSRKEEVLREYRTGLTALLMGNTNMVTQAYTLSVIEKVYRERWNIAEVHLCLSLSKRGIALKLYSSMVPKLAFKLP